MSPKFYSFLWILYFVAAGVMWLGGALTMLAFVVFGFIAFGLTFMGMMCVLPSAVSHPTPQKAEMPKPERGFKPVQKRQAKAARGFSAYGQV
ncbi:MAG: hypothetical protein ACKVQJ_07115 [Pyrinomonadaceae bacterium]